MIVTPLRVGILGGMGPEATNAAVETFFKTIKAELIWRDAWDNPQEG